MSPKRLRPKRETKIIVRVCKATFTRPIPQGAKIVITDGQRFARFKYHGKVILAPLTKDGKRCRIETEEHYIRYKGADGVWRREKGYTDLEATEAKLRDIRRREERKQAGVADPFEDHYTRPLVEKIDRDKQGRIARIAGGHLGDFYEALSKKNRSREGVWHKVSQVATILTACGFKRIPEIEAFAVERFLAELADNGRAIDTCNHYLSAFKHFCAWLVRNRRMRDNPVAHLEKQNPEQDRRRIRRELSAEEVERLLEATAASPKVCRGLTGMDRFVLYYVALGSGLRAHEIACLTPESFDLDGEIPLVVVEARTSKHGKRDEQPLQPDLVPILREYLKGKPAGEPVWPGSWYRQAAKMLRIDLKAAEIPYVDDQGRYADFHAQRHTYITVAGRHLPLQMAQLLARHGDVRMTQRYMHLELRDAASAASQLPPLVRGKKGGREALQATGTEDRRPDPLPHPCQESDISRPERTQMCTIHMEDGQTGDSHETLENKGKHRKTKGNRAPASGHPAKALSKSRCS